MRSYNETDKSDVEKAARLRAEPWMLDLLKINPSYTSWGPYEDYMCDTNSHWRAPMFLGTWAERPGLDELNEVVNFYFWVKHTSVECDGHSEVFTSETSRLSLTLWILHPRKGASRGCEIATIQREELPEVFAYLREAAARNAARFGAIP